VVVKLIPRQHCHIEFQFLWHGAMYPVLCLMLFRRRRGGANGSGGVVANLSHSSITPSRLLKHKFNRLKDFKAQKTDPGSS
jgi:hypothetical protein